MLPYKIPNFGQIQKSHVSFVNYAIPMHCDKLGEKNNPKM